MTVSIIIAAKTWARNLEECVRRCQELDYPSFEIIILPDAPFENRDYPESLLSDRGIHPERSEGPSKFGAVPISVIPTGPVSPAKKRDIALAYAKGEILAFIDDDAYPEKDWLKNAVKNFSALDVVAVGGPAVTAQDDNLRQRASGIIYANILVSSKYTYRYLPKERLEVDDYPTCNFFVRKSIMEALGGFKTNFWPGEDTKLCLDITKELRKKIIYDPEVLVYHHRRPLFLPHLRQVASYAVHRGYFVKKYPETSLQFSYFIPTLFLFVLLGGAFLSLNFASFRIIYFLGLFLYLSLVFFFSVSKELRLIPLVFFGIILTHLTYGFWFVKGLLSKKLKEEL